MVSKKLDQHPQLFRLPNTDQAIVNTLAALSAPTPVMISPEKSWVMELLKVWFTIAHQPDATPTGVAVAISDRLLPAGFGPATPGASAFWAEFGYLIVNLEAELELHDKTKEMDLTDGDGNGMLFAGKLMYLNIDSNGFSALLAGVQAVVLYRLVEISASEYVGIVER